MPVDPLNVALAAAPPLTVLVLMTGLRMGGAKAGPAGWLVALLIAVLRFGAGGELLLYAHLRALVLTIDVVLIVWAALALYQVVHAAGALNVIAAGFGGLTGDRVLRVLLTGWVFASFLQGVGGFGVPIAGYCAAAGRPRLVAADGGDRALHRPRLGGNLRLAGLLLHRIDRRNRAAVSLAGAAHSDSAGLGRAGLRRVGGPARRAACADCGGRCRRCWSSAW